MITWLIALVPPVNQTTPDPTRSPNYSIELYSASLNKGRWHSDPILCVSRDQDFISFPMSAPLWGVNAIILNLHSGKFEATHFWSADCSPTPVSTALSGDVTPPSAHSNPPSAQTRQHTLLTVLYTNYSIPVVQPFPTSADCRSVVFPLDFSIVLPAPKREIAVLFKPLCSLHLLKDRTHLSMLVR